MLGYFCLFMDLAETILALAEEKVFFIEDGEELSSHIYTSKKNHIIYLANNINEGMWNIKRHNKNYFEYDLGEKIH